MSFYVSMAITLAFSLALTIVLECGLAAFAGIRKRRDLILIMLVQIMTNPLVVATAIYFEYTTSYPKLVCELPLEVFAVLAEWIYYRKMLKSFDRPFSLSLGLNGFSYSFGIAIFAFQAAF